MPKGELTLGIHLSYYGSCQKGDGCLRAYLEGLFGEVSPLIFLTANAPLLDQKSSGLQLISHNSNMISNNSNKKYRITATKDEKLDPEMLGILL